MSMNKTLVITGKSGIGKTSFVQLLLNPILGSHPVVLTDDFQSPKIHHHNVRVLISPDDAKPEEFYNFTLIPNGEFMLNVKYRYQKRTIIIFLNIFCKYHTENSLN